MRARPSPGQVESPDSDSDSDSDAKPDAKPNAKPNPEPIPNLLLHTTTHETGDVNSWRCFAQRVDEPIETLRW